MSTLGIKFVGITLTYYVSRNIGILDIIISYYSNIFRSSISLKSIEYLRIILIFYYYDVLKDLDSLKSIAKKLLKIL